MKRISLCLTVIFLATTILSAGDIKIGYLDVDYVYNEFSEKKEVEQQFNQEVDEWMIELDEKNKEIERLKKEYENLPPIVTELRKEEKLALIEKKENEYITLSTEIRDRAVQRQLELMKPISEKIVATINVVAEEKGFDLVLDSQQGLIVYAKDEEMDITDLVLQRLNETTE